MNAAITRLISRAEDASGEVRELSERGPEAFPD